MSLEKGSWWLSLCFIFSIVAELILAFLIAHICISSSHFPCAIDLSCYCSSRKKRLTPHWKTYIQSYTWRCKWVELQLRRFLSQALKYDLQLAENNQRKQLKSKDCTVENLGAKSLPLSSHARREKVMKRKKRKRVEDTIDKAAHMAQHNLFSYFGTNFFHGPKSCFMWLLPSPPKWFLFHVFYFSFSFELW